ncbi:hypothetical protein PPL_00800 [Heterostelium album PN500]|uniref:Uncharacterized protein n=1 Tax=Heterostelium pallidum (strain ATCC 26659 / Pp 5 / PN500) TaxID=670386 RepID=D3AXG9_HETP5|nr:hypothetical protein PPL_00800 [Heterostelium album PN500]EFA86238.1 hypothetical protein PPL_00800 [Heterostelium album PN500]|eukprot:XP_020438343.1 hypothetical protein PPL_00800 [Heterostelium album PN500]
MIENNVYGIDEDDNLNSSPTSSSSSNNNNGSSSRKNHIPDRYLNDSQMLMSSIDGLVKDKKLTEAENNDGYDEDVMADDADAHQEESKKFYRPPLPSFLDNNDDLMRKITLVLGVLTMLVSGTLYGFAVISVDVKEILDFDQTEISNAISIGDVGIY